MLLFDLFEAIHFLSVRIITVHCYSLEILPMPCFDSLCGCLYIFARVTRGNKAKCNILLFIGVLHI